MRRGVFRIQAEGAFQNAGWFDECSGGGGVRWGLGGGKKNYPWKDLNLFFPLLGSKNIFGAGNKI